MNSPRRTLPILPFGKFTVISGSDHVLKSIGENSMKLYVIFPERGDLESSPKIPGGFEGLVAGAI